MYKTLIIVSSTDGHTQKIASFMQKIIISGESLSNESLSDESLSDESLNGESLSNENVSDENSVHIVAIEDAHTLNLALFDKVVIGASIRYGKHADQVADFITKNKGVLASKYTAFFSVNLVARKAHRNTPDTNPYVVKFFKSLSWQPNLVGVFAGKLDYAKYTFLDRWLIQGIMLLTKGPTARNTVKEYTNWQDVTDFAIKVRDVLISENSAS